MNLEERPHYKKERRLSSYMCQELLYDYLKGILDNERKADVENFLSECEECEEEKQNILFAMDYCDLLAKTQVSKPLENELLDSGLTLYKVIQKMNWRTWPPIVKWSFQAFVISSVVALIAIQLPWFNQKIENITHDDILILAKVKSSDLHTVVNEVDVKNNIENKGLISIKKVIQKSPDEEKLKGKENQAKNNDKKLTNNLQDKKTHPKKQLLAENNSDKEGIDEEEMSEEKLEQKTKLNKTTLLGRLYRVSMRLENVDDIRLLIKEKIIELGGKRGGRVEIGLRKEDGAYYHFSMSDLNETKLFEYLKSFGVIKVYEQEHSRVMKKGLRRYILWIEDLKKDGQ